MKVLGIETSTRNLGVAILDEDKGVLAEHNGTDRLRHEQDLIPMIDRVLRETHLRLADLDSFAVSIGPGSFTGLRIGVSTVKGLNLATKKPIVAVPTMDVMAYNIEEDKENICVIIDAKKAKLYACLYAKKNGKLERKTGYLLTTMEELLKEIKPHTIFLGDGITLYRDTIRDKIDSAQFAAEKLWPPRAGIVAALGVEKLRKSDFVDGDALVPMYLYSRECSIRGIDR